MVRFVAEPTSADVKAPIGCLNDMHDSLELSLKVLFFQYGDFRSDWLRLSAGGSENYRDQRTTVEFIAGLRSDHMVEVIAVCDTALAAQTLVPNLKVRNINQEMAFKAGAVSRLLNEVAPDAVILRAPNGQVIQWARRHRVPTLPLLADMFHRPRHPWALIKSFMFKAALLDEVIPCVANHSLNASLSLAHNLFMPLSRIVPWDRKPLQVEPMIKSAPTDNREEFSAIYAGALSEGKGVGDALQAVRLLKDRGLRLQLRLAGSGDMEGWKARAEASGIADQVAFLGQITNDAVRMEMRKADVVLVTTRHDYAEGLPNTLCEGLASRTPVIMSDHPAFASRLQSEVEALIFHAGSAEALAAAIQRIRNDPSLYVKLSENSAVASGKLFFGLEWSRLVQLFLSDPHNRTGWVFEHSLAHLLAPAKASVA